LNLRPPGPEPGAQPSERTFISTLLLKDNDLSFRSKCVGMYRDVAVRSQGPYKSCCIAVLTKLSETPETLKCAARRIAMQITETQSRELLQTLDVYVAEACDRCSQILGQVRYTRRDETGEWCSRARCDGVDKNPGLCRGCRTIRKSVISPNSISGVGSVGWATT
jgi:hypothetical protein